MKAPPLSRAQTIVLRTLAHPDEVDKWIPFGEVMAMSNQPTEMGLKGTLTRLINVGAVECTVLGKNSYGYRITQSGLAAISVDHEPEDQAELQLAATALDDAAVSSLIVAAQAVLYGLNGAVPPSIRHEIAALSAAVERAKAVSA